MTDIAQKMRDDADQLYACDSNWWLMDTINYLRDGADEIDRLKAKLAAWEAWLASLERFDGPEPPIGET